MDFALRVDMAYWASTWDALLDLSTAPAFTRSHGVGLSSELMRVVIEYYTFVCVKGGLPPYRISNHFLKNGRGER